MQWAYGVTTVPQRLGTVLPDTLQSLSSAGFNKPHLFVDGARHAAPYEYLGLQLTIRYPAVNAYGNWVLTLWELYVRNPTADRYAVFQDDIATYHNLRQYLEQTTYRGDMENVYYNLYTYPVNQTEPPTEEYTGWHPSNQMGRGALGLVFNRPAVTTLLAQHNIISHPQNSHRGHRGIDGTVVTAFRNAGYTEQVHAPTLVQHTGTASSTLQNRGYRERPRTYRGAAYNALDLLPPQPEGS